MASKFAFFLLLAVVVAQCAADDFNIVDILKNSSQFIDELKVKFQEVEDNIKNGAQELLNKAKSTFEDLQAKVEEQVAKGTAAAQCLKDEQDQLSAAATKGVQDTEACVNKAVTDLQPLASEVATVAKDIAGLAAECAGGNALSITICVAKHADEVKTTISDISKAVKDIPSTYTELKSVVESCQKQLSADMEQFQNLVSACV